MTVIFESLAQQHFMGGFAAAAAAIYRASNRDHNSNSCCSIAAPFGIDMCAPCALIKKAIIECMERSSSRDNDERWIRHVHRHQWRESEREHVCNYKLQFVTN
jgi:hypothetical protein